MQHAEIIDNIGKMSLIDLRGASGDSKGVEFATEMWQNI